MQFNDRLLPKKKSKRVVYNYYSLLSLLMFFMNLNGFSQSWIQVGEDIEGQANWESSGYFIAMSDDGKTVVVGAPFNDEVAEDAGKARVYHWEASSWVQKGNDINGTNPIDDFGYSVSISSDGNIVAAGAIQDIDKQRSAGYVRVFSWDGSEWAQMGEDITGEVIYDRSGTAVSLSDDGNTVAIGSRNGPNGEESGSVRVFTWNGSAWVQKGQDLDGELTGDSMGWSLCLDSEGNTLVVGIPQDGVNNPGFVKVYEWDGPNWAEKGQTLYGDANGDRFGWATSISAEGNEVAVGARQNGGNGEQSGQLKVFSWNGAQWEQKGTDIYGSGNLKFLGWSLSLSADGNTVAAGVPALSGSQDKGSVEVYTWNNSQWELKGDIIEGDLAGNRSGWSIAMSAGGDFVAVGTPFYTGNNGSGQVKVYTYGFTSVHQNFPENFSVYPNPAKEAITIDLTKVFDDVTVIVSNQVGQVVSRKWFENVDLIIMETDFPAGIYAIRIITGTGISTCMKVVIIE
jgi:hypothetical protein